MLPFGGKQAFLYVHRIASLTNADLSRSNLQSPTPNHATRSHLGRRKTLLMKLAFTIIVAVTLASIAAVAEATNSSVSNQVSRPPDFGNLTKLTQRKKIPKSPSQSDPMKQYEQDKLKGWYKIDRA